MHNLIYFLFVITFLFNSNLSPTLIKLLLVPILVLCSRILVTTTNQTNAATGKQLLIGSNINTIDAFGKYNDTAYTNFYNVRNLFDNQTNTWSFWSQYDKSGIVLALSNPLDKPVCSVELDVYKPQNTPYNMRLGSLDTFVNFDGNLANSKEVINIDNCIKDVKGISLTFNADKKWTTLSEFKLFSNSTNIPPVEPPICTNGYHYDPIKKVCVPDIGGGGNVTHITINNGTALMDVTDSKIVLNIDADSQIIENHQSPPKATGAPIGDESDNENDDEEEDEDKN